ncbi:hypothetical protein HK100_000488 [Physocladia obscura]|uniref:Uncharacterized protein n=1 Tax=Physocladia obscura TaxID=109957 RepID=A0AAD5XMV5_9FUNG|nr:hypothetical protein HK100_000488 [Physocladia obscura]
MPEVHSRFTFPIATVLLLQLIAALAIITIPASAQQASIGFQNILNQVVSICETPSPFKHLRKKPSNSNPDLFSPKLDGDPDPTFFSITWNVPRTVQRDKFQIC